MELIVETPGVLVSKHQGRLRVMRNKEKLQEVPLVMLEQVLITSNGVAVTSDVVRSCSSWPQKVVEQNATGLACAASCSPILTGPDARRRELPTPSMPR